MSDNPIVRHHREQIAELDLKILEALNQRIHLVRKLKDYKEVHGLSFHDAAQEERVITRLSQANQGPLSDEGLIEIFRFILEAIKREAAGSMD
jgi:chorismate mutase/prephenate dehydratase